MKREELTLYRNLLGDIKARIRQGQRRAALSANAEMLYMYWDVGRVIAARQTSEGWGAAVLPRLATDLKNEFPEQKGFSLRNLKLMVQFYKEYPSYPVIGQRPVAQLANAPLDENGQLPDAFLDAVPATQSTEITAAELMLQVASKLSWAHNVVLIQKLKDIPTRLWYAKQVLEQGWSRDTLTQQIKNRAHERQGAAVTNFSATLPVVHAAIAHGLLKDPYVFDFLTFEEPFHERELETGLLQHIQKFLIELGRGFAFVGRQYHLEINERDFYVDLLFYHLQLRCFVVVDLKKGEFKPEYAGKMNFYCSAVDDLLRHKNDAPTIGLILCQHKDQVFAEYALRDVNKPIGLAEYELTRALPTDIASSLPSIEDLENELAEISEGDSGE
jgi:predicted nuclease of restriction endonuclease-like (RecB) superfamily